MSGTGEQSGNPHGPTGVASGGQRNEEKRVEIAQEEAAKRNPVAKRF